MGKLIATSTAICVGIILTVLPTLECIMTTHHDKPQEATMASYRFNVSNIERQKRLYPYSNYYEAPKKISQRYRKPSTKYTPFLGSNAIPGPFRPIQIHQQPIKIDYVSFREQEKAPDFAAIYDRLSQLKLHHQQTDAVPQYEYRFVPTQTQKIKTIPVYEEIEEPYKPPSKTTIETFTATNIDVSPSGEGFQYVDVPSPNYAYQPIRKPTRRPPKPAVFLLQTKPWMVLRKPKPTSRIPVEEKFAPPIKYSVPLPEQYVPQKQKYQVVKTPSENPNGLADLLKQLQQTNTLPQTLTPDNIDNSIKTLVKILETIKKRPKFTKPIVVQDDYEEHGQNETGDEDITSQDFPENTPEGGTPGKPGIDYPALSKIPPTSFDCKSQRYKGFFGDPDTNCQVWHYCDLNGGQASFLCPNGTIFSQVALTCDWWYNVKCASTPQLYVLNERLYKYIIPLTPKFPEDYSGPLVDKYLALKFQEMEDKLKKQKKGKTPKEDTVENTEEEDEEESTTSSEEEEQATESDEK